MSFFKKYLSFSRMFASAMLIFVGLMFAVFGTLGIISPGKDYQSVNGTIVKIDEYYDMLANDLEGETQHKVYVNYVADGKKYTEIEYPAYSSSMKEGGTVTVLYDPEAPTEIQSPGGEKLPYIFAVIGAVLTTVGVVVLVKQVKNRRGSAD